MRGGNGTSRIKNRLFYDTDDPRISVVESGVRVSGFAGAFVIAALFVPFGLWGLRAGLKT